MSAHPPSTAQKDTCTRQLPGGGGSKTTKDAAPISLLPSGKHQRLCFFLQLGLMQGKTQAYFGHWHSKRQEVWLQSQMCKGPSNRAEPWSLISALRAALQRLSFICSSTKSNLCRLASKQTACPLCLPALISRTHCDHIICFPLLLLSFGLLSPQRHANRRDRVPSMTMKVWLFIPYSRAGVWTSGPWTGWDLCLHSYHIKWVCQYVTSHYTPEKNKMLLSFKFSTEIKAHPEAIGVSWTVAGYRHFPTALTG